MKQIVEGSIWRHRNGVLYRVITLANTKSCNPDYVPQVIYETVDNGNLWVRSLSDWHRSMTLLENEK